MRAGKLFPSEFPDLMTQFHLMISVVHVILVHAPPDTRKISLDQPPFARAEPISTTTTPSNTPNPTPAPATASPKLTPSPAPTGPATLEHLCNFCGANVSEVLPLYRQLLDHVRSLRSTPNLLMGDGRKNQESAFMDWY